MNAEHFIITTFKFIGLKEGAQKQLKKPIGLKICVFVNSPVRIPNEDLSTMMVIKDAEKIPGGLRNETCGIFRKKS